MSYPKVKVRGEDLPPPFQGWDDQEYSLGHKAVYYPTEFRFTDDGYLYLRWTSDESDEHMWINKENIDSVKTSYD